MTLAHRTVHTGTRCGTVAMLGGDPTAVVPGMRVGDLEQNNDACVAMNAGGFLHIDDGRFIGWFEHAMADRVILNRNGGLANVSELVAALNRPDDAAAAAANERFAAGRHATWGAGGRRVAELEEEHLAMILELPYRCGVCAALKAAGGSARDIYAAWVAGVGKTSVG